MFIKSDIVKKSKYIILTDSESIYDQLKEENISNIAFYEDINFESTHKNAIEKRIKVVVINNKDHYKLLQEFLKEKVIFLKLSEKRKYYNQVMGILYDNINLINISQYNKKYKPKPIYIPTGFPTIDYSLNDLQTGNFYLVTGRTGHGKSAFVDLIQINAIENQVKTLVLDGEHQRGEKIDNYRLKLLGRYENCIKKEKENKREILKVNELGEKILKLWEEDNLFLYSSIYEKKKKTRTELFEIIMNLIILEGINLIIFDNIMSLNVIDNQDKNEAQKDFVENCRVLAKNLGVCVVLVAHPRKPSKGEVSSEYDISGSSDIPNSGDVIIEISKSTEEEKIVNNNIHGHIRINKNRQFSEFPIADTYYDPQTKCLFEIKGNDVIINKLTRLNDIIKLSGVELSNKDFDIKNTKLPF